MFIQISSQLLDGDGEWVGRCMLKTMLGLYQQQLTMRALPAILQGKGNNFCNFLFIALLAAEIVQGPVVQSIVSLTSSLRGQLVKCFVTL